MYYQQLNNIREAPGKRNKTCFKENAEHESGGGEEKVGL